MAIYHFTSKIIQRSQGKSVVAAAAYRHATKLKDRRMNRTYDYSKKKHVIHSELLILSGSPWTDRLDELQKTDPREAAEQLWNKVESTEKRIDAQLARDIEFSLPVELTQAQGIALAREFLLDQFVSRGMIANMNVHWDPGNPHVHVLLTMRGITPEGFGKKVREWNHKGLLEEWRKQWSEYANFHLRLHGIEATIDHRSYADQGIDLIPGIHEGRGVHDMEKRAHATERMEQANAIRKENLKRIVGKPTIILKKITQATPQFTTEKLIAELGRYVNDKQRFDYTINPIAGQAPKPNQVQSALNPSQTSTEYLEDCKLQSADNRSSTLVPPQYSSSPTQLSAPNFKEDQTEALPVSQSANVSSPSTTIAPITASHVTAPDVVTLASDAGAFVSQQESGSASTPDTIALSVTCITDIFGKITEMDSVFSEREIATSLSRYTNHAELFVQALVQLKTSSDLIHLGPGEDGRERYTTKDMFELENQLQDFAECLSTKDRHRVKGGLLQQLAQKKGLSAEQTAGLEHILNGKAITALVGRAGTGKSYALDVARDVLKQSGFRVMGIALSGVAANGLAKESGMPSRTISSFLWRLEQGQEVLTRSDVVVMDEAGMTDSRSLHAVLKAVSKAGAKLILVGDHAQLQPVGPGAPFRALLEWTGFAEFTTVFRQKVAWQRQATQAFAKGDVDTALTAYDQHGFIDLNSSTLEGSLERMINAWANDRKQHGGPISDYLMLGYRNQDVDQLNQQVRARRLEQGEINAGLSINAASGSITVSQDDRLLFLKNDNELNVKNGQLGTITRIKTSIHGVAYAIHVRLDGNDQREIIFDPKTYNAFKHGYAVTVHKAQGVSVNFSYVCAAGRWTRDLMYVAMSRHRKQVRFFADKTSYPDRETLTRKMGRTPTKDSVFDYPINFMRRRGIASDAKSANMMIHLKDRLKHLIKQLIILKNPEQEVAEQAAVKDEARIIVDTVKRRDDAKIVYRYVVTNQQAGKAWAEVESSIKAIAGPNPTTEERAQALALVKKQPIYKVAKGAIQTRNQIAYKIHQAPHRYQRALVDEHGISLGKVASHANIYARQLLIDSYLNEVAIGRTIYRDRLAAQLKADIKTHYPLLKENKVDTLVLSQQAQAHERRLLLKHMTPAQRADFKVVAHYHHLAKESQRYWSKHSNQSSANTSETTTQPISSVWRAKAIEANETRDTLALQIVSAPERYQVALEHYHISVPGVTQDCFQDARQIKVAENRWVTLKQRAQHANNINRIAHYITADDAQVRQRLAHKIVLNAKDHHGGVIKASEDKANDTLKAIWQKIRSDAKAYERAQLLPTLTPEQQSGFLVVEDFVSARRESALHWADVFDQRSKDIVVPDDLMMKAKAHTVSRNELALKIKIDPIRYQPALDFYHVSLEKLDPAVHAAECRNRIEQFSLRSGTIKARVKLAQRITLETKAHYSAMVDKGISWEIIYRYANIGERLNQLRVLSPSEQADYQRVMRYRNARIKTAKGWGNLFDDKKMNQSIANQRYQLVQQIGAHRDYLAHELYNKLSDISAYCQNLSVPITAILDHASRHQKRLNDLSLYFKDRNRLLQEFHTPSKTQSMIDAAIQDTPRYHDWRERWETFMEAAQGFKQQASIYASALQANGLSTTIFESDIALTRSLDRMLKLQQVKTKHQPKAQQIQHSSLYLNQYKRWNLQALEAGLYHEVEQFIEMLLGEPSHRPGKECRYGKKGSLWIGLIGDKRGVWFNHETGQGGGLIQLVQYQLGCDFKQALEYAGRYLGLSPEDFKAIHAPKPVESTKPLEVNTVSPKKQWYIDRLYRESQTIQGTLAERYLKEHRSINILGTQDIRFHAEVFDGLTQQPTPALLTFSRNTAGELVGLQRIFLDAKTANKIKYPHPDWQAKRSYGPVSQGAVLVQAGKPGGITILAEGPETALSVAQAQPDACVYTTLGISNMRNFNFPVTGSKILIAADQDGPNASAKRSLEKTVAALSKNGLKVSVAKPAWNLSTDNGKLKKIDFNDVLKKEGIDGVNAILDNAQLVTHDTNVEKNKTEVEQAFKNAAETSSKLATIKTAIVDANTIPNTSIEKNEALKASKVCWDSLKSLTSNNSIERLYKAKMLFDETINDIEKNKKHQQNYTKTLISVAESQVLMQKIKSVSNVLHDNLVQQHRQLMVRNHPDWNSAKYDEEWDVLSNVKNSSIEYLILQKNRLTTELTPRELNRQYKEMSRRVKRVALSKHFLEKLKPLAPGLIEHIQIHALNERTRARDIER